MPDVSFLEVPRCCVCGSEKMSHYISEVEIVEHPSKCCSCKQNSGYGTFEKQEKRYCSLLCFLTAKGIVDQQDLDLLPEAGDRYEITRRYQFMKIDGLSILPEVIVEKGEIIEIMAVYYDDQNKNYYVIEARVCPKDSKDNLPNFSLTTHFPAMARGPLLIRVGLEKKEEGK